MPPKRKKSQGPALPTIFFARGNRATCPKMAPRTDQALCYRPHCLLKPLPRSQTPTCEYQASLSKADLDASLEFMYEKLATKFQTELHKTFHTLSQEIAALGTRTDMLETKHDKLALAYGELSREYDSLASAFSQMQSQIEDLDNRKRRNNLRLRGIPESETELIPTVIRLFKSLLLDCDSTAFTHDRIHRALRPKPPADKPPRDVVLCMMDFLTKEEILRAARIKQRITLDEHVIQIYPDISPATLDRHRGLKEVTSALQSARIRYKWGFPSTW